MFKNLKNIFKLKNKYSITFIIGACFLSMLILQSGIILLNFLLLKTDEKLDQNTYSYTLQKADDTSKEIERYMIDLWSNKEYMSQVNIASEKIYQNFKNNKNIVFDKIFGDEIVDMINQMKVSGAFVAFNHINEDSGVRQVIHIRDSNVDIRFNNKSDITMRMGSEKIARSMGISLESLWEPYLKVESHKNSIYEKAIEYSRVYNPKEYNNMGFWISPTDEFDLGKRSVYFIQPLYDNKTNELYAIIGIEINQSLIDNILRYSQLSDSEKSAYILISKKIQRKGDEVECDIISMKGPYVRTFIKNFKLSATKIKNKYYSQYSRVKDTNYMYSINSQKDSELIAVQRPVRLYTKDFYKDTSVWYLMAVIDRKEIETYSSELMESLLEMIIISIIVGGIFIYFVSFKLTHPITVLSNNIKEFYENETIRRNEKLNIKEIDNLIETIENLSFKLIKSSKKFQKIMESATVPLVAIETDYENDTVHKLGELSTILPDYTSNEPFEVKMRIQEYRKWSKRLFNDSVIIDSIYDIEKETQTDIREKIWKGKKYYIKIISKRIDNEELNYINANEENKKTSDNVILQIIMDNTKEMTERIKIQKERDFDVLTNLLNRLSFKEAVEKYIEKDSQNSKKAAMIMWDLDNLKYVNDTYGHDNGDEYLKLAGEAIGSLKEDGAFVARVSGDEFFAFLEYKDSKEEVRKKIKIVREKLFESTLNISENTSVKVRATTGVTWYPDDSCQYLELHKYADFAMYTAKHSIKGSIAEFNRELYDKNYILFSGKESLNKFIEERQVKFAFQPIVNAVDGSVFAYEALLRSTSLQINSVTDVMRLAKSQSRLTDIEALTFEGVFKQISQNEDKLQDKYVFINSIASVSIPKNTMKSILNKYGNYIEQMVIEIIENEDVDLEAMEFKQKIRKKYNCKIAIDDFGTGYATESWLLQVNPDFVKIDMSLIRGIDKDKERQSIISNILRYTKERNIKVICEGIETYQEVEKLIKMGVDYIQGYYLGKPTFDIKEISEQKKREIQTINALKSIGIE